MANPHSVRISDKQMIVYAHEALYCLHESDWTVLGIYKTKTLAYKAMRRRLWQHYDRARDDWLLMGRSIGLSRGDEVGYREFKYQRITPYEVQEEVK